MDWFPDWRGETAVLVGSGPSARDVPLSVARGKSRFVAVNESWRLCPWADVLYACDECWWTYRAGVPEFTGLKVSQDERCKRHHPDIKVIQSTHGRDDLVTADRSRIAWTSNSGFQALNLIFHFGVKRVVMVGIDMTGEHGTHWHGNHPAPLSNPVPSSFARWIAGFEAAAPVLAEHGVEVINCSPISVLRSYPKRDFAEVFA